MMLIEDSLQDFAIISSKRREIFNGILPFEMKNSSLYPRPVRYLRLELKSSPEGFFGRKIKAKHSRFVFFMSWKQFFEARRDEQFRSIESEKMCRECNNVRRNYINLPSGGSGERSRVINNQFRQFHMRLTL